MSSERRDIADIVRTADALRREAPGAEVWARIRATLPPDTAGPGQASARDAAPAPTRAELRRRARDERARRRTPRTRRARHAVWWAAAAAVALLAVATWTLLRTDGPRPAASYAAEALPPVPPSVAEQLDLVPAAAAPRAIPAEVYEGVTIREGRVGVDQLRVCRPC